MKRVISFILVLALVLIFVPSCSEDVDPNKTTHIAEIKIKNYGTVVVELYGNKTPITVDNFVKLCEDHFYDGLTFHRIISGFMAQGGGFAEDGTYKSATTIKGEFKANGVDNDILHERGVISMARANAYNSGSSQFFIMHKTNKSLDGLYAAFGRVTSGMDIIDQICTDAKPTDNNGSIPVGERPVIESITIREAE